MKIWMKFKKATKHIFVFEECDELGEVRDNFGCKIPTLYIRKGAIKEPLQHITVVVEPGMQVDTDNE